MKSNESTKQRILEEALTLFAVQGYDGTSVDQIAERVGIKGPSLYKHFKGKEDILNALIDAAEARYEERFGSEANIGPIPQNKKEFVETAMKTVSFAMNDPMIRTMRKLLVQEQFRNERIAGVTSDNQVYGLIKAHEKILDRMMKAGLIKTYDPGILSVELTAPALVMVDQADRQPEREKEILHIIKKHIIHFCDVYMK